VFGAGVSGFPVNATRAVNAPPGGVPGVTNGLSEPASGAISRSASEPTGRWSSS
jgi:hypothetical protein